MKRVVMERFGGPEVLKLQEADMPRAGLNDVLIRVEKTSVNFADIKKRNGQKGDAQFPMGIGLDVAGVVTSVGDQVTDIAVGQRVIAFPENGSYAEYAVAKQALTFAIPDEVDFTTAAACPTVSILSYKLLIDVARLQIGETVLVHAAAGGVGTTAIQLAKLLGARTVIGTVSNKDKFSIVEEAGADHVLLYDDFSKHVNDLTSGIGANIILDSVAGKISEQSMKCLAKFGRLVQFGNSGGKIGKFHTNELHASCRSILGFSLGTTRKERPEFLKEASVKVLQFIANKQLTIKIGAEFPLTDVQKAHELIESRKSMGKIVLNVRGDI
ncbi:quinone oxidoreductase family protein [Virgibacillus oceani]|uniref:Quinone oxidoreductase n=1 Tax=Virgibacillus oceani TaxID=1479511 RepID=A0A917M958_9BACI|nr:zinc-binding dehydrogenase [Virgibacillus oceani]GGG83129.1 quinone oxidoreductase [Virgibacillus oceani]